MTRSRISIALLAAVVAMSSCRQRDYDSMLQQAYELAFDGEFQEAEVYLLYVARKLRDRKDPEAREYRAKALYEAGRIERLYLNTPRRAIANLREALRANPSEDLAYDIQLELADVFRYKLGDCRNAVLEYQRLVDMFPNHPGVNRHRFATSQCYFLLRRFDEARAEARILLEKEKDPEIQASAMLLIANSYFVEGRYAEAVKAHRDLLGSRPPVEISSRSLYELGLSYQSLGELKKAEEAYLAALVHHPRPDIVQMSLRQVRDRIEKEGYEKESGTAGGKTAGKRTSVARKPAHTSASEAKSAAVRKGGHGMARASESISRKSAKASKDSTTGEKSIPKAATGAEKEKGPDKPGKQPATAPEVSTRPAEGTSSNASTSNKRAAAGERAGTKAPGKHEAAGKDSPHPVKAAGPEPALPKGSASHAEPSNASGVEKGASADR